MADIIKMRRMSDTMEEGVIVEWLVEVGDKIDIGDVLAEVETDKATMDFDSQKKGTVLHIEAEAGDTVPVDQVIAVLGEEGEDYKGALEEAKANASKDDDEEDSSDSGEKEDAKNQEDKESDSKSGSGDKSDSEDKKEEKEKAKESSDSDEDSPKQSSSSSDGRIKASPLAKKLAEEKGYDLSSIEGTGDYGRIVKRDVENHSPSTTVKSAPQPAMPVGEEGHTDHAVSQMRKAIARRLSESKFTAPHFYLTREINMDRVVDARKSINEYLGHKVSFNDIIIKAAASALRMHPDVNASWMGDKIRKYQHIHVGVATAIDDGLIVPVIKHADSKQISGISAEVKDLAQRAKDKKLQPEEFSGNTFTISNLGMFGIEEFTAIINPPDACIMAVGGIVKKPVVIGDEIKPANIMKVTLSCDHRVVDGAMGAKFLQTFAQFLEEPLRILA